MLIKANGPLKIYIAAGITSNRQKGNKNTWSFLKRILY